MHQFELVYLEDLIKQQFVCKNRSFQSMISSCFIRPAAYTAKYFSYTPHRERVQR